MKVSDKISINRSERGTKIKKMKRVNLFLIGLLLVASGYAQNLKRFSEHGREGFLDSNGKVVIPAKYDYIKDFSDGIANAGIGFQRYLIDETGKEISIPKHYEDVKNFSEGMAKVEYSRKFGYIDKTGKEVVPLKYDHAEDFIEGLACVMLGGQYGSGGKYGYINKMEKEVIPLKYDYADNFSEGLARVKLAGKSGYIDKFGKIVIPLKYDNTGNFSEGLARVMLAGKFGFIDKTGKEVIPLKYDIPQTFYQNGCDKGFSEGLACVMLAGKYGFIDKTGQEIIPLKYDLAQYFSEGLAKVDLDRKMGYVDKTGKEVVPLKYDIVRDFYEGLALVNIASKSGYIDKTGNEVVPLKYDDADYFHEGLARVMLAGKWGYIDTAGNEVIPPKYDKADNFSNGNANVMLNGKNIVIDKTGALKYGSMTSEILCESFQPYFKQMDDYRAKFTKSSVSSGSFLINRPYLFISTNLNYDVDERCSNMQPRKYSENASFFFNYDGLEKFVVNLKTLIVSYPYLDFTQLYNYVGSQQNVNIESYGVYLIYFDMDKKKIIGHDVIRGANLPEKTSDPQNRLIGQDDIMKQIETHLAVSQ